MPRYPIKPHTAEGGCATTDCLSATASKNRERSETSPLIKYELIIYWSNEDNAFIAEVPELPGCMADGQTYQEALANVEVVISEWIETAQELGRPIPEPRGRLIYA
jgi:predicted RNase H-like HicB family nuclease